ncbi:error-prone DNA polymerase [Marinimicrococcus flavescens]|uniref:Error-prone DNA polymerase n=1 Tax=Marinimicrococcus flavescens TaxID=3031815 RepID=A0AAP3V0M1_9PROT|nr:error-prone DNA polymerase [Marinimicrococcus flavescens]
MAYAELQTTSNFSFLRGASHPEELVERAHALGLAGLALTDRNSFAGLVRAHGRAKELGLRFVPGCRLDLVDGTALLCWPRDRAAYGRLSSLLTLGKRRAAKAACMLTLDDVLAHAEGQVMALLPPDAPGEAFAGLLRHLRSHLGRDLFLAASHLYRGDDAARIDLLAGMARDASVRLLATNDAHCHDPARRRLQDVLTCIREHCTIAEAGRHLFANAERHLKPPAEMARLFRAHPGALESSLEILERCRFSLDELAYDYPVQDAYEGRTPDEELARRTWTGAAERYPDHLPEKVRQLLARELELIAELRYAPYFLTVHDIVLFARSRGILCQGRGSAANSAVCYALGITSVDPARMDVLFERFVSAERDEPPDIDVDFEHERREEVIQHIYATYGRDHAALAATVIRYRSKSALREVAKVMGLSADVQDALSRTVWGVSREGFHVAAMREAGLDPSDPALARTLELAFELMDFPRHLSQHVGGFVIAKSPLRQLVPIENAAMPERTVVEWDKDDLDALRMLKIDVLALGMLSCIRRGFELLRAHYGIDLDLARVPAEDPAVYEMLSDADSIGVFQVESRAQMSMLPRLKPRTFYDLVIEVAIVRPGPIQGDMVHPYLRRREGREPVEFPSRELEEVLGKTLGVPLFQEQAMRIAMVAAGFTPAQADGLRRAMAAFRRKGALDRYKEMLVQGMAARGYDAEFAERCFRQIEGFGYYGFPESHAASFALLVYVSAWLKCHYPDVFCAAILNAQPMGFYAPAQLVRDAVDHGVEARPVDVNHSYWDCTLEPLMRRGPLKTAVRLGLRQVRGLAEEEGRRLVAARLKPYRSVEEVRRRAGVRRATLIRLAEADAFRSLGMDRRQALWAVQALKDTSLPLFEFAQAQMPPGSNLPPVEGEEPWLELPEMPLGEQVIEDYATLRLSLKAHPLALLRGRLAARRLITARDLWDAAPGRREAVAGLVLVRQRPGSAQGVVFATLEDETGFANIVLWPSVFERFRATVMTARLMAVTGTLQREGRVIHVVAERLADLGGELARLKQHGLDPHLMDGMMSRADEFRHETREAREAREAIPDGRNFR